MALKNVSLSVVVDGK